MNLHQLEFDAADVKILGHLQINAKASNAELAEIAHLSASQCHRRVKRLEEIGVIESYGAKLNAGALKLDIHGFIQITLGTHGENPAKAFEKAVESMPEVLECYSLTGDTDYLIRVSMPNLQAFSDFLMHQLMPLPFIQNVKSSLVLEEVRRRGDLPLGHLEG